MKSWYSRVSDIELKDGSIRTNYVVTFETDNFKLKREVEKYLQGIMDKAENSSEIPNNCEHITEDGVTCAKYPACDDCLDNPLNKVKGSERLVKGKTEPTISKMEQVDKDINVLFKDEPQIYKINPKEPTNMPKCFDCEDFFTCDGQCEIECEKCKHFREKADTYMKQCEFYFMECRYEPKNEPQTDCPKSCPTINICTKDDTDCPWK